MVSQFFSLAAYDATADSLLKHQKVALLFLTISDLNHSTFWSGYLEDHLDKYNVYIHSKTPLTDSFFSRFQIANRTQTSWAYTVKARKLLIDAAIQDEENQRFVLLTESCIPLFSADTLYSKIMANQKSVISWCNPWWESSNEREMHDLPKNNRKVNQSSFILNRSHAEICARDQAVTDIISRYPIDSEAYPASLLSFYGNLEDVDNRFVTYVDWKRSIDGSHPYLFQKVKKNDIEIFREAQSDGYLFARKFAKSYPESIFLRLHK